ncbi:GDP-mannose 4,6-dehydratase [Pseudomonas sp. M30-35]|uniref:GDP-mannose 4,6-dehydratase n=1 Tax=Pseudomonas sp. M30-35 TaxID=1981174 RepID=UPI000B3BECD4|nr:GDP-mannose 4,6-dehydratase [Pseudomonas sp. M30-35]ARU86603.1 NAD-dependent dehydratase [Pseudomonas sp. M30-35]
MSRLFVTGRSGFVGQHLEATLAALPTADWQLIESARFDLLVPESLDAALAETCPDAVIHLAGQTFVPEAFRDPQCTFEVNLLGTLNLLQALKRRGFSGTFLYVSSGDVYGRVDEADMPIAENLMVKPRNPYAVSKVSAELLCLQWAYTESWRVMIARPFNHIGSGQSESFLVADMARQLIRIKQGLQAPVLNVGDVDVTRDFLDVGDVVAAYLLLLEKGQSGEVYNLCSGMERKVRDVIMEMAHLVGVKVVLEQDPARLRRAEQRRVVGCARKLQTQTGWKPCAAFSQTLLSVLSDWEGREQN